MRWWWQLLVLGLALAGSPGCGLLGSLPLLGERICESIDDCAERGRNRRWAKEVFCQVEAQAGQPLAKDYRDGFIEGFAEYLYQGGAGDPPPLPPARYRALCYQNLAGYRAIEQWFAGYRDGAATARTGGYRQFVTGPTAARTAAVLPAVAPPAPKNWPSVIVRIDPLWLWRNWPCCQTAPRS